MKRNTIAGFMEQLVVLDSCVEWPGRVMKHGYVLVSYQADPWLLHRLLYEYFVGPIPEGLDLHHECKNKRCMNMEHIRPVTRQEHIHLDDTFAHINSLKATCPKGHPLSGDNLYEDKDREGPHRRCRICRFESKRKGTGNATKTMCPKGHPYEGDNVIYERDRETIHRKCRTCVTERERNRSRKKKSTCR